ncbi:LAMI_0F05556g1_1 [Lachancea mirantina]|uniref:LAMI_0F05556g1_1 n=1 Tax=Lachancea mirantina TaxID=1230905 RepID=A0A1G4JYC0_9SACH|nr:LAMI_0F05556g1_1 [Lachancea mirantina]
MSKRYSEPLIGRNGKEATTLDALIGRSYTGYAPEESITAIAVIDIPETEKEIQEFYEEFVIPRRPCKINGVVNPEVFLSQLTPEKMATTLDADEVVQVERKVDGGFGSGEKRLKMKFGDLLQEMERGNTNLYLTTQYAEDDPELSDQARENESEKHSSEEHSSEEESKEEDDPAIQGFGGSGTFSDNDSLNFDDLHDDFSDSESGDHSVELETLGHELETGPMRMGEAQERIRELYQPPITSLVKTIPELPRFLDKLLPQQINLWVGCVSGTVSNFDELFKKLDNKDAKLGLGRLMPDGGSSSGLHHDHADNLYVPIAGRKRFTLFSPKDAVKMYTIGDIREVFCSGLIDYHRNKNAPFWRKLRDDGALVAEVARHVLKHNNNLSSQEKQELERTIELDDEFVEIDGSVDPPSFSKIPPAVLLLDKISDRQLREEVSSAVHEKWPLLGKANRIVVNLEPGEMLYLPTGWFHEVSSFGEKNPKVATDKLHVAVNYWFIPPNGRDTSCLYSHPDRYWPLDYERTKAALKHERNDKETDI